MKQPQARKILITRPRIFCSDFAEKITREGHIPIVLPMIKTEKLVLAEDDLKILHSFSSFDWIIFASRLSVKHFFEHLTENEIQMTSTIKFACIGNLTVDELQNNGYDADFVPTEFSAKSFSENFATGGAKILIPSSDIAPDYLAVKLRDMGHEVTRMMIYKTGAAKYSEDELNKTLEQGVDFITFTSNSTVNAFFEVNDARKYLTGSEIFVGIGPETVKLLQKWKLKNIYMAKPHSVDGVLNRINKLITNEI